MDNKKLKMLYGQLKAMERIAYSDRLVLREIADDYSRIVQNLSDILNEDLSNYNLSELQYFDTAAGIKFRSEQLTTKLLQLIAYLEYGHNVTEAVIEIGSIYNSIHDEELKGRCSDILTASENFDRVINQATLVLEDRIRTKSKLSGEQGVTLVNKAINSDLKKSVLATSSDPDEHEGIAHICRGIVFTYRNPTHHRIIEDYSREDALKFCAFIDLLLTIIGNSKVNTYL